MRRVLKLSLASAIVAATMVLPALRGLFGFAPPGAAAGLAAVLAGMAGGASLEAVKWHPWVRRAIGHQQGAIA